MGRWIARSFSTLLTEPCVKTHTSAKCRKHNSPARHRTSLVQYDLTPTDAIAQRYFYVWRDRWSFRTAKTHPRSSVVSGSCRLICRNLVSPGTAQQRLCSEKKAGAPATAGAPGQAADPPERAGAVQHTR